MAVRIPTQRGNGTSVRHHPLRTLIVGAGTVGRALARDLDDDPGHGLLPVGFVDDDPTTQLTTEYPVLGTLDRAAELVLREAIDVVVMAVPTLDPDVFRKVAQDVAAVGASVRYVPSFVAALERDAVGGDLRWLEVGRLVGSDRVHTVSTEAAEVVRDKVVLVSGAGGALGSELCRRVYALGPRRLVMLDRDDAHLDGLRVEFRAEGLVGDDDWRVADVRDRAQVDEVFAAVRPQVVFHAAAHEDPALLEHDPGEAVAFTVAGTQHVVRASTAYGAERFLLISSGEAATATSLVGATHRLAELLVQTEPAGSTRRASVRLGNLLAGRGSLLSELAEQISRGLPVTLTHPEMTRFLVTMEEAAVLLLEATRLADAGEVLVLDMGRPVHVIDLVDSFAHLMNRHDVEIRFTGLRVGEKLHERLLAEHERPVLTAHPRVLRSESLAPATNPQSLQESLDRLFRAAGSGDVDAVRSGLRDLLADQRPVRPTRPVRTVRTVRPARSVAPAPVPAPYSDNP